MTNPLTTLIAAIVACACVVVVELMADAVRAAAGVDL